MNIEQALNIIKQAIDISLSNGVFKTTKDVVTIDKAYEIIKSRFQDKEEEVSERSSNENVSKSLEKAVKDSK